MNRGTGCLSGGLGVLAVVVAVLVIISLPAALLAYDVGQVVFSKEKVTQIIVDQLTGSDEVRRVLVVSFLSSPAPEGTASGGFSLVRAAQGLSDDQTRELTNLLLPQEWFREQVGSLVGAIYAWIDGDQSKPQLTLDLRPVKEKLLGGGAQQLMLLLIDSWPQCLTDQLAQIEQAIGTSRPPPILYCKPPSSIRGIYTERSTIWFTNQVRNMPDTIALTGEGAAASGGTDLIGLRDRIQLARDVLRYGWMIPASLFGLIMALAVRSWLGLTRWWGATLTGAGLASLVLIPFTRPLQTGLLREVRPGRSFPPVLVDALTNAAGGIRTAVVQALAAQASLLILVGAALLIGSWLLGRRAASRLAADAGPAPAGSPYPTHEPSERPSGIFG